MRIGKALSLGRTWRELQVYWLRQSWTVWAHTPEPEDRDRQMSFGKGFCLRQSSSGDPLGRWIFRGKRTAFSSGKGRDMHMAV